MYYSLFFFLLAAGFGYYFKEGDNFLYRKAVEMVKVDPHMLRHADDNAEKQRSLCQFTADYDYACTTTTKDLQQYPIYIWGGPGTRSPKEETAAKCALACAEHGPGFCAWRENGPEYGGATTCLFVSRKICSNSDIEPIPFSAYLPSQVKSVQSGRCD
ncbi:MAG: hypothetical protein AB7K68_12400 [Bacteriovoracia bacterium]